MKKTNYVTRFIHSITFKFILIGIISLFLLIPAEWVKNLILEREQRGETVLAEISSEWGYEQYLTGPWLTIPCRTSRQEDGKTIVTTRRVHFLPEDLSVDVRMKPEIRHRGIFKVILYSASIDIKGSFTKPDFSKAGILPDEILWDDAALTIGITDMRGIRNNIKLDVNGSFPEIVPGTEDNDLASSGFHAMAASMDMKNTPVNFSTNVSLNGTKSLNIYPLGKTTQVSMASTWNDPSFTGAFLPAERKLDEEGFHANWLITHLNRNFPQAWTDDRYKINESSFGVELLNPVDHYQQSYRSVKYALMFIGLTFLLFLLMEILIGKKLHPIQYILTGLALIIFYSLLVSLSEHTDFGAAYLVSSAAVILLISYYIKAALGKMKYALLTSGVLSSLYLFLYIVLRMQDFALLLGSIGLFTVLGIFMILTRNINWYREETAGD